MGPNSLRILGELLEKNPKQLAADSLILDLACGTGLTSFALCHETGVKVLANDLWISGEDNAARFAARCVFRRKMMDLKQILRNFLDGEGKLTAFPAKRKMKIYALFYLADKFEAGRNYSEQEVNDLLLDWHRFADPATLRRELYEYHFLDRSRDGKVYHLADTPPSPEGLGI